MSTYTKNDEDVADLWEMTHIDQKFFYYDAIIAISNQKP